MKQIDTDIQLRELRRAIGRTAAAHDSLLGELEAGLRLLDARIARARAGQR